MSFIKKISLFLFSLVVIFSLTLIVSAQVVNTDQVEPVSCFELGLYKFQSVQVNLHSDKPSYKPGDTAYFSGTLTNENNYPIVDGYLFVRVVNKNNTNPAYSGVADEFFALSNLKLNSKEEKTVSYSYVIPASTGGKVSFDYFFSAGKKFNLGGLPFTNEVIINSTLVNVVNNIKGISFNKAETTVNGGVYNHIGAWPIVEKNSQISIKQPIINNGDVTKKIIVTYDLFYWDSLNNSDLLSSKTEQVEVAAQKEVVLSYDIPKAEEAVYYLRITAIDGGVKSIVNIRVVANSSRFRINYPAITNFPLKSGETFNLFSCFHNTTNSDSIGRVVVSLEDNNGTIIGSAEYTGPISSEMLAVKKEILAKNDLNDVTVKANIYDQDNKLVDSYAVHYTCSGLNSDRCAPAKAQGIFSNIYFVVILVVFILILLAIFHPSLRKGKIKGILILLSVILFIALLFLSWQFVTSTASAQTPNPDFQAEQTVTTSRGYAIYFFDNKDKNFKGFVSSGSLSAVVNVNMLSTNGQFNVGDRIGFSSSTGDIVFNALGGAWDSPYGVWCTGTDCNYSENFHDLRKDPNYVEEIISSNLGGASSAEKGKLQWGITEKPVITFTSNNPAVVSCTGRSCLAVSTGTAVITADIDPLKAKYNASVSQNTDTGYWAGTFHEETVAVVNLNKFPDGVGAITDLGELKPNKSTSSSYLNGLHFDLPDKSVSWPVVVGGGLTESCSDGVQNQNETGIDCGGVCPACGEPGAPGEPGGPGGPGGPGDPGGPGGVIFSACGGANGIQSSVMPTSDLCAIDNTVSNMESNSTGWSWICSGTPGFETQSCSAHKVLPANSSLNCSVSTDPASPVNINTLISITGSSTVACPTCQKNWTIADANGSYSTSTTAYTLDHRFTTVGLKTISLQVSSSTSVGAPCGTTTLVVSSGGSIREQ